ncbi:MAG: DsrE family protein [Thiohalobacterales bacterium]|nr:DsrE family protein [Thiohalobacterales bacterium]
MNIHRIIILTVIVVAVLAFVYSDQLGQEPGLPETATLTGPGHVTPAEGEAPAPDRSVLDITVHTIEELQVLFDRAEKLAAAPRTDARDASVVLVLHGPEVEFFSTRNYLRYREIVDQAARLDAHEIVDVRICQAMMAARGIARDDIPAFIEQVPDGQLEVDRLVREGYVYF